MITVWQMYPQKKIAFPFPAWKIYKLTFCCLASTKQRVGKSRVVEKWIKMKLSILFIYCACCVFVSTLQTAGKRRRVKNVQSRERSHFPSSPFPCPNPQLNINTNTSENIWKCQSILLDFTWEWLVAAFRVVTFVWVYFDFLSGLPPHLQMLNAKD